MQVHVSVQGWTKAEKKEITKSFFKKYSILVVLRNNTLIRCYTSSITRGKAIQSQGDL